MKVAYFDCFSGISGDMALAALIDAGCPVAELKKELKKIAVPKIIMEAVPVTSGALGALRMRIESNEKGVIRTYSNIKSLLEESRLPEKVVNKSLKIMFSLASAEAKIHRVDIEQVHFHEIGAIDTIVDIVGTVFALEYLGIEKIYCSPLPTGYGMIKTEHGIIPNPSPAVLEILKDVPMYSREVMKELVTPTGAAIIKTLAVSFGPMPAFRLEKTGYGAGTQELGFPNVLRVLVGEEAGTEAGKGIVKIETNLDNTNPEQFTHLNEVLFEAGALDVWTAAVQMKKNRPGTMLSVLAPAPIKDIVLELIFTETNTLGVRIDNVHRIELERKFKKIKTRYGEAHIKLGYFNGKVVTALPEFEEVKKLAKEAKAPFKEVYEEFSQAARKLKKS